MSNKRRGKKEPRYTVLLKGSASDLRTFYQAPPLKGFAISQEHRRPGQGHVGLWWTFQIQTISNPWGLLLKPKSKAAFIVTRVLTCELQWAFQVKPRQRGNIVQCLSTTGSRKGRRKRGSLSNNFTVSITTSVWSSPAEFAGLCTSFAYFSPQHLWILHAIEKGRVMPPVGNCRVT